MSRIILIANIFGGFLLLLANFLAWANGVNWGAVITSFTVLAGVVIGLIDRNVRTKANRRFELEKTEAANRLELEKAEVDADAYKRRSNMSLEAEWEKQHAESLKQQIAALQQQSTTLQRTLDDNTRTTEALREENRRFQAKEAAKLTEIKVSQEQHAGQLDEVKAALVENTAATTENKAAIEAATAATVENKADVTVGQARQDAEISQGAVATSENAAAIERIGGKTSEAPDKSPSP